MQLGNALPALIGLGLIGYAIYYFWRAARMMLFLEVPAEFERIDVVKKMDSARSYHKLWFAVEAGYRYSVSGKEYESTKVGVDQRSSWTDDPREADLLASLIRTRGTCFVNERDPSRSVLLRQMPKHRRQHYVASISAGLILIGISVTLIMLVG